MSNKGLTLYLIEAKKHQQQYVAELDELKADLVIDNFRARDYRALERLLQIYTELCIGLSKHWLKLYQKGSATDAYQTFSLLRENGQITRDELLNWRRIIGMRNGLVHDYLNIDLSILEDILLNDYYQQLTIFSDKALTALTPRT